MSSHNEAAGPLGELKSCKGRTETSLNKSHLKPIERTEKSRELIKNQDFNINMKHHIYRKPSSINIMSHMCSEVRRWWKHGHLGLFTAVSFGHFVIDESAMSFCVWMKDC
uniref:Uncharacterized protein n=1 Tax=Oryzias melastigma TaxID=30732 RepID=A0A3B3DUS2_ORYME